MSDNFLKAFMKRICVICNKTFEFDFELEPTTPMAQAEAQALDRYCPQCYERQEELAMKQNATEEMVPTYYPEYRAALIEIARNQTLISEKELAELLGVTVSDIQDGIGYAVKDDAENHRPLLASLVVMETKSLPVDLREKVIAAIKNSRATSRH